jgi:hypothetical protein
MNADELPSAGDIYGVWQTFQQSGPTHFVKDHGRRIFAVGHFHPFAGVVGIRQDDMGLAFFLPAGWRIVAGASIAPHFPCYVPFEACRNAGAVIAACTFKNMKAAKRKWYDMFVG